MRPYTSESTSQFNHSQSLDIKYAPFSKSAFDQNSFNKLETSKNLWWMLSDSPVFAKALKYITVCWLGGTFSKSTNARMKNPQVKQMWEQTKKCECCFLKASSLRFVQSSVQKVYTINSHLEWVRYEREMT